MSPSGPRGLSSLSNWATVVLLAIVAIEVAVLIVRPSPETPTNDWPTWAQMDDLHKQIDYLETNGATVYHALHTICVELDQGTVPIRDELGNELDCGPLPLD